MKEKKYDYIKICLGYPKRNNINRTIWRKWNGVEVGVFETHLFGKKEVYAINLKKDVSVSQFMPPFLFRIDEKILTLNLKAEYFHQIRLYKKDYEFREIKPYWTKRLFEEKNV